MLGNSHCPIWLTVLKARASISWDLSGGILCHWRKMSAPTAVPFPILRDVDDQVIQNLQYGSIWPVSTWKKYNINYICMTKNQELRSWLWCLPIGIIAIHHIFLTFYHYCAQIGHLTQYGICVSTPATNYYTISLVGIDTSQMWKGDGDSFTGL